MFSFVFDMTLTWLGVLDFGHTCTWTWPLLTLKADENKVKLVFLIDFCNNAYLTEFIVFLTLDEGN